MGDLRIGDLEFQLNWKAIKHLHISVLPPDGKVRVSAPERMTENAIRMALIARIPWIRTQQRDFADQPRQSARSLESGESHYLWGRHYRLDLREQRGQHHAKLAGGGKLQLTVTPGAPQENRQRALNKFYRDEMRARVTALIEHWQPVVGVQASFWGIKKMKTKWGSCNTSTSRIWLNLELAKKPPECLEYILVHELAHLLERHHNERFKAHLDRLMPDWRERRDLLNQSPLAFEDWSY
ncbi:hypothetical protein SAMN04488490_1225 [Marinobacter sp. LV10R510-11A]|uniref:M48 family metallopeptidase n=1 Tax=Marinobacter sp. LV10R510-11A TaxID=1415568 RepID=UPI000BC07D3C|nr:SprT family zinc-dependent metalloprotease [Marinobacter sp. LV10R510-11A]SOB75607.1 hypothetical protein SAMN04488490_1225 [Marinobacter sp. LV10R510-11A]